MPELSEYGFALRYRGHWGIRLRMRPGQLEVGVPPSDRLPIATELPDRAVSLVPGESCRLTLRDH
ncbi:glycosyl hydrolase family 65 protein [Streptomyces sp. NPDC060064]|uniref:glycosyl hydrolase family 65 protein n=1 Tax=Streptomyces sp. NPDC060064 TaxID=3347049 RepID=UPI0036B5D266